MNMRAKTIIVLTATLILTTIVILPRITKAGRFKWFGGEKTAAANAEVASNPGQDRPDQNPDVTVTASYHNDTSPPLRDMKQTKVGVKVEHEANENPKLPTNHKDSPDPVVQGANSLLAFAGINVPSPILNFDGIV